MGVDLVGIEAVQKHIQEMESRLLDKKDFITPAATLAVGAAQDAFNPGNPLGWQALDPKTIRKKGNSTILVDTGKMARTMAPVIGPDYVGVKYTQYYGRFHQEGRGVPQRAVRFTEKGKKAFHDLMLKIYNWQNTK